MNVWELYRTGKKLVINQWYIKTDVCKHLLGIKDFFNLNKFCAQIPTPILVTFSRFTTFEDKDWFVENFWKTAAEELPDVTSEFPEGETFFVNFLREPLEPTGDEDEDFSLDAPKIYEELPS